MMLSANRSLNATIQVKGHHVAANFECMEFATDVQPPSLSDRDKLKKMVQNVVSPARPAYVYISSAEDGLTAIQLVAEEIRRFSPASKVGSLWLRVSDLKMAWTYIKQSGTVSLS